MGICQTDFTLSGNNIKNGTGTIDKLKWYLYYIG